MKFINARCTYMGEENAVFSYTPCSLSLCPFRSYWDACGLWPGPILDPSVPSSTRPLRWKFTVGWTLSPLHLHRIPWLSSTHLSGQWNVSIIKHLERSHSLAVWLTHWMLGAGGREDKELKEQQTLPATVTWGRELPPQASEGCLLVTGCFRSTLACSTWLQWSLQPCPALAKNPHWLILSVLSPTPYPEAKPWISCHADNARVFSQNRKIHDMMSPFPWKHPLSSD